MAGHTVEEALPEGNTPGVLDGSAWVGFGTAVDWIAFRDREWPVAEFAQRIDEAALALVAALAALEPEAGGQLVQGIRCDGETCDPKMAFIPHGIWPVVAVTERELGTKAYSLALVDSESEWGGTLISRHQSWDRLRIRTYFLIDNWPAASTGTDPAKLISLSSSASHSGRMFSQAAVRLFLEAVVARVPESLIPLTINEIVRVCQARFSNAPRDFLRDEFKKCRPSHWPSNQGPRGSRQSDRTARVAEFSGEMLAAELPK